MTRPEGRKLLNEMYTRQRLKQIDEKERSGLLEARFKSKQLRLLETKRRHMLLVEQRMKRLFEAISTEQLQSYIGWFDQVKAFVNKHDLPTLKSAIGGASNDVLDLFRGMDKGKAGFIKTVKSWFTGEETRGDDDRLNNVNHFLWGITTVLSSLPTMLQALDRQMDGMLFTESALRLSEAEKDDEVDPLTGVKKSDVIDPAKYATAPLGDYIERAFAARGDADKGKKVVATFRDLITRTMSQAVAKFGAGKIPYLEDPEALANDLLQMELGAVQSLGEDALTLKKHWESQAEEFQQIATAIDTTADTDNPAALVGGEGEADEPTEADDEGVRHASLDLPDGKSWNLTDENIESVSRELRARLERIKMGVTKGKSVSARQERAIGQILKLIAGIK